MVKAPVLAVSAAVALAACGGGEPAVAPDQPAAPPAFETVASPAADGSLAPYLATGHDGAIVMSWLEPAGSARALRYARYDGSFGEPATVATGDDWFVNWADFPSVVPVSDSLWGAHWLVRRPAGGYAYDVYVALSTDGGQSWSEGRVAHTDGTDTEHGFVSLYPDSGGLGLVHLDGRKMVNEVSDDPEASGMTLRAARFLPDGTLTGETLIDPLTCDCCQTDVAQTDDGLVAVYRDRTAAEIRDIHVARRIDGEWQAGRAIANDGWEIPGCPVNGPEIHARGRDVAVAWFTAADDRPRVRLARSSDAGATFSEPVDVADGALLGHVGMTVDADGTAWITYQEKAADGGARLVLRSVGPSGTVGDARVVEAADGLAPFSVPQVAAAGDHLLLAWTEGGYGESHVETARLPLD